VLGAFSFEYISSPLCVVSLLQNLSTDGNIDALSVLLKSEKKDREVTHLQQTNKQSSSKYKESGRRLERNQLERRRRSATEGWGEEGKGVWRLLFGLFRHVYVIVLFVVVVVWSLPTSLVSSESFWELRQWVVFVMFMFVL
jgi:hypothetical protein